MEGGELHMLTKLNRLVLSLYTRAQLGKEDGQALVEYTLILALVSVVAIAGLTAIGTNIETILVKIAGEI
jgi:Flp pilus assembly pilin Flp